MPGENSGGLNEQQAGPPARPEAGKADPKKAIPPGDLRERARTLQHRQLLPEGDVLEADVGRVDAQGAKEDPDTEDEEDHHGSGRVRMTTQPKLYSERDQCRVTSVAVGPDELFDRHRSYLWHSESGRSIQLYGSRAR